MLDFIYKNVVYVFSINIFLGNWIQTKQLYYLKRFKGKIACILLIFAPNLMRKRLFESTICGIPFSASYLQLIRCHVLQNRGDGKTQIKKVFFSGRTTKVLTLPTLMAQWSMPLYFIFFRLFSFGLKQSDFREKKWFFAQWSGGFTLPTPLVVRPLKNAFFMCVFPNSFRVHR